MLIIRDTRESGEMLEAAVAAGVAAAGGEALLGGILPTPGAPLLIARHGFDLGVVLSASHNPYRDNGIKFFGGDGYKLSRRHRGRDRGRARAAARRSRSIPGRVRTFHGALEDYLRALAGALRGPRPDAAGGSCSTAPTAPRSAPRRRSSAASAPTSACSPTSPTAATSTTNCGSTHMGRLQAAMQAGDDEAGFAFDGDGDRMLAVDRNGVVVDGDELIALAALHLRDAGRLPGNGVAVTVMTNYGFHTAMAEHGVEVATTPVGDRYVLEALRERDWALGGEQSGHIIDRNFVPSGDGIAAALLTLEALGGADLADRHAMEKLPQTLVNVRVRDRGALEHATEVHAAVERESAALEGRGRVLLRPSGTEPLVRVMVEAPTRGRGGRVCGRLVSARRKLNSREARGLPVLEPGVEALCPHDNACTVVHLSCSPRSACKGAHVWQHAW